jgi:hypothetical protein
VYSFMGVKDSDQRWIFSWQLSAVSFQEGRKRRPAARFLGGWQCTQMPHASAARFAA